MEKPVRGIRIFGFMLVAYGILTLLGLGSYSDFKLLLKGLSDVFILSIYAFSVGYGILCVLCGTRILRLEEWARKTAVKLVLISLLLGLFLNTTVFRNLENVYALKESAELTLDTVRKSYVVFGVIFTLFELSFIYYFTRPAVKAQFKENR